MSWISGLLRAKSPEELRAESFQLCVKRHSSASSTTKKVIEAIGGLDKFCALPELKWKRSYRGNFEYFFEGRLPENILPSDVTFPLMRGIDGRGLDFLVLRARPVDIQEKNGSVYGTISQESGSEGVEILFRLFRGDWISGGGGNHYRIARPRSSIDNETTLARLNRLAHGKTAWAYHLLDGRLYAVSLA